jgi:hypothetical protein
MAQPACASSEQVISDYPKFPLTLPPNQLHIPFRLIPREGRIMIVICAGWDAVDAAASSR